MTEEEFDKLDLGGYGTLKQAHRELAPEVGYHGFRSRVLGGMSILEAGTAPKSPRGRPRKVTEEI